jgi:hypothetical protein
MDSSSSVRHCLTTLRSLLRIARPKAALSLIRGKIILALQNHGSLGHTVSPNNVDLDLVHTYLHRSR